MHAQVTVVIPTRDRWALLGTTLRSVLAQNEVSAAIIVVDDGGTDSLPARMRSLGESRIRVVRHSSSRGVAAARNTGLAEARTPWVAFLDDDDLWSPRKLERQLRALDADGSTAWACSGSVHFYGDGTIAHLASPPGTADVETELLRSNVIPGGGSGVVVDAATLRSLGGFDEQFSMMADWELWIRLAKHSPLTRVDAFDVAYRDHVGSMSQDVGRLETELRMLLSRHSSHGREVRDVPVETLRYLERRTYSGRSWWHGVGRSVERVRHHAEWSAAMNPVKHLVPGGLRKRVAERRLDRRAPAECAEVRRWLHPLLDADPEAALTSLPRPDRRPEESGDGRSHHG